MSIPNIQSLLFPLLQHLADGEEHVSQETVGTLATLFQLSEAERAQLLPSGNQTIFTKRVAWAKSHLTQAGLIAAPRRGVSRITDRGREMLQQHPQTLTLQGLNQFAAYRAFRSEARGTMSPATHIPGNDLAPQKYLELGFQQLRTELAAELLSQIKACPPDFFERLVIELLVALGYGGSRQEAGQAVGKSGDGGIDGMIKEDRLGLDVIYIQAKRYINTIWVDEGLHRAARALLLVRRDKTYSLCDAVSFVLMRQHQIIAALTTDRHFVQEGFQRLL